MAASPLVRRALLFMLLSVSCATSACARQGDAPRAPAAAAPPACASSQDRPPRQIVQGRPPRGARLTAAAFSPDERYVALGFLDDSVHVFEAESRRKVASYQCSDACQFVWTDGAHLHVREKAARASLDVASGRAVPTEASPPIAEGQALADSPRGRWRVDAREGRVALADARTGRSWGALGSELAEPLDLVFVGTSLAVMEGDRVSVWSLDRAELTRSVRVVSPLGVDVDEDGHLVVVRTDPADTSCANNPRTEAGGRITPLFLDVWPGLTPPGAPGRAVCIERLAGQSESRYGFNGRSYGLTMKALDVAHRFAVMRLRGTRLGGVDLRTGESTLVRSAVALTRASLAGDGKTFVASSFNTTVPAMLLDRGAAAPRRTLFFDQAERAPDAVALSPDGSRIAMSSGDRLRVVSSQGEGDASVVFAASAGARVSALQFDARGALLVGTAAGELRRYEGPSPAVRGESGGGAITRVRVHPTAPVAATISDDGAVRVWDLASGALRGTLVRFADGEWSIATPGGAYSGTPEVGERIAWAFADPAETFAFEQFSAAYQSPDVVRRRLAGESVDATPCMARPPRVTLVEPPPRQTERGSVRVVVRAAGDAGIQQVRAFVEGRLVAQAKVGAAGDAAMDLPLLAGVNRVALYAFDAQGASSNALTLDVTSTRADLPPPSLWVVSAGVSRYPLLPETMQLPAAAEDARGIVEAFRAQTGDGRPHGALRATLLVDDEATPDSIRAALGGLARMGPNDTAIVFLAGHGFKPDARADMVFATGRMALGPGHRVDPAIVARTTVSWKDIGRALAAAKGRVVVMLDACHSGHVSQQLVVPSDALAESLVREQRAGAIVLAAAKGTQPSFEPSSARGLVLDETARRRVGADHANHGFFTGAVLAALSDASTDRDSDGAIQLSELIDTVVERVSTATQGEQTPWIARRDLFGDFTIASGRR